MSFLGYLVMLGEQQERLLHNEMLCWIFYNKKDMGGILQWTLRAKYKIPEQISADEYMLV